MGTKEPAPAGPSLHVLASAMRPYHILFNSTLKPISSFNLWRPHKCPTLVFILDGFHLGNFLGFLSIPRTFPGLHLPLPSPTATGEPRGFMAKASRGKLSTNLSHPLEMSQAEQSTCFRHGRGTDLIHEIKSVFCSVAVIQRRTNFFHASARPRGLQLRCCTPIDVAVLMDFFQTDIGKQNRLCVFVSPAPLE